MPEINNQLLLSAIGAWRDNLPLDLIKAVNNRDCEIADARMSRLGDTMTAQLLITGNWSGIGKLETALPGLAERLDVQIQALRTAPRGDRPELRPFACDINAPQQPQLLATLLEYFSGHEVVVSDLATQEYGADQTGAAMINLQMMLLVPITHQPPALRDSFMDLCDDIHADGIMEPVKS